MRGVDFGTAVFVKSFWPLCLLATQTVPTLSSLCRIGRRDFYVQAEHGSLPPHALDMLVIRIGQLMTGDFHSIRFSALTAAPSGRKQARAFD